jgi:hypothetical protein
MNTRILKAILWRNSSPIGRTSRICGLSALLLDEKGVTLEPDIGRYSQ